MKPMKTKYVIGTDFGTDSCRIIIVDVANGQEIASSVKLYTRWAKGLYCNPQINQYRQHPLDYIEAMESGIKEALSDAGEKVAKNIIGISFDMTGSTPALVNTDGLPLSLLEEYKENPNAMFILWKDHTAIKEAEEINRLICNWHTDYTMYEGGIYSAEWVWAKVLHVLREDKTIRNDAYSWIEHTDWIPALLTGNTKPEKVIRSRCAAGHKAMWSEAWNGLPSEEFLTTLSPLLKNFRSHLYTKTYPCNKKAGQLTKEWVDRLGLNEAVVVGVGAIDCHMGAVGTQIKPKTLVKVMGTSTCDVMVAPYEIISNNLIPGICGQVDGSVIPGMIGLEAGQSAFGDVYAWFRKLLEWPLREILRKSDLIGEGLKEKLIDDISNNILPVLSEQAQSIADNPISTDWFNGRRTPYANQLLKGTISGLSLGSTAPMIYRSLVEATAYGSKAIIEHFIKNGIEIDEIIAVGGISQKAPFVMQTLADVLGLPIKVAKTNQGCALGAAMFAAVIAGAYETIEQAQEAMGQGFAKEYLPNMNNHNLYLSLYEKYKSIGKVT